MAFHAVVDGAGDDVLAIAELAHRAAQRERLLVHAQVRERALVAQRNVDLCTFARREHLRNCFGVAQWAHGNAAHPHLQRGLQHVHGVAGASGHAVVSMIEQQHRLAIRVGRQLLCLRQRRSQRLAVVDELGAPLPYLLGEGVDGGLRLAHALVALAHRGNHAHAGRGNIGQ
ncbi:hypothetical protein SDC9_68918 [bioreactor metagenome]|uniref:Uncharacterized protein n=1 Tax=bioreactor metagenome TaxID=1076179 RepID=A0A644Y7A6_9ZZZZ